MTGLAGCVPRCPAHSSWWLAAWQQLPLAPSWGFSSVLPSARCLAVQSDGGQISQFCHHMTCGFSAGPCSHQKGLYATSRCRLSLECSLRSVCFLYLLFQFWDPVHMTIISISNPKGLKMKSFLILVSCSSEKTHFKKLPWPVPLCTLTELLTMGSWSSIVHRGATLGF